MNADEMRIATSCLIMNTQQNQWSIGYLNDKLNKRIVFGEYNFVSY